MKRKIVSISILTALLLETASPLVASDWFAGYDTGSTPRSWTDGGGGKYLYGGDFTYRFKRNTIFKPILEIKPPGITAGCNGVSVSGGFIHFLGLDEIKQQLQSAGQGAMMGVVVGIVYSLPGIADAFDKVQKYVRMLQQILSGSCQASAAATKQWIDGQRKAAKDNPTNLGYENTVGEIFNSLNSTVDGWTDSLNQGPDILKDKIVGILGTSKQEKKAPTGQAAIICNQTCQLAKANAGTDIKNFVQQHATAGQTYADGTINNMNELIRDSERLRGFLFSVVFLGYYALDATEFPKELTKEDYAAQLVQQMNTGGTPQAKPVYQRGLFFNATNSSGKQAVDILLHGVGSSAEPIKMPKIKLRVYYSETNSSTGEYSDITSAVLFGKQEHAEDASGFEYDWQGLIPAGQTYLQGIIFNGSTSAPTIPSVFPGMSRYVTVLKTQHRAGQSDAYINSLITLLATKNAVMLLQSIVNEMQTMLYSITDATDRKSQEEAIDAIYKELVRLNKSDASIADTVEIFEKIEREHGQDITGGIRSKNQ